MAPFKVLVCTFENGRWPNGCPICTHTFNDGNKLAVAIFNLVYQFLVLVNQGMNSTSNSKLDNFFIHIVNVLFSDFILIE